MSDAYVGQIMLFAGPYAPEGWLPCDGRSLQMQQYQVLAAVIGYTYGGQGTSFNLPDFRGFFPTAAMQGQSVGYRAGVAGTPQVAISAGNLPAHTHPATFVGTSASATANVGIPVKLVSGGAVPQDGGFLGEGGAAGAAASIYVPPGSTAPGVTLTGGQATVTTTAAGTVAVGPAGGSQPLTIPVPLLTVMFCICYDGIYPQRP